MSMETERKKQFDGILNKMNQMIREKSFPVTEEDVVEHPGIIGSFEFGFLCGYLIRLKEER